MASCLPEGRRSSQTLCAKHKLSLAQVSARWHQVRWPQNLNKRMISAAVLKHDGASVDCGRPSHAGTSEATVDAGLLMSKLSVNDCLSLILKQPP